MNRLSDSIASRAEQGTYLYTEIREYPVPPRLSVSGWPRRRTSFYWPIDIVLEEDGNLIQVFHPHRLGLGR